MTRYCFIYLLLPTAVVTPQQANYNKPEHTFAYLLTPLEEGERERTCNVRLYAPTGTRRWKHKHPCYQTLPMKLEKWAYDMTGHVRTFRWKASIYFQTIQILPLARATLRLVWSTPNSVYISSRCVHCRCNADQWTSGFIIEDHAALGTSSAWTNKPSSIKEAIHLLS